MNLNLNILCNEYQKRKINERIISVINLLNEQLKKVSDEYDKVLIIYNLISRNVKYNALDTDSYSIKSVFLRKEGVCQSISLTFKLFCDYFKIPCFVITGTLNRENHAWNIVRINNCNFHVDVTQDLSYLGTCKYTHCFMIDKELEKDYFWEKGLFPKCNNKLNRSFFMRKIIKLKLKGALK